MATIPPNTKLKITDCEKVTSATNADVTIFDDGTLEIFFRQKSGPDIKQTGKLKTLFPQKNEVLADTNTKFIERDFTMIISKEAFDKLADKFFYLVKR